MLGEAHGGVLGHAPRRFGARRLRDARCRRARGLRASRYVALPPVARGAIAPENRHEPAIVVLEQQVPAHMLEAGSGEVGLAGIDGAWTSFSTIATSLDHVHYEVLHRPRSTSPRT